MSDIQANLALLKTFEKALDTRFPERNPVPTRVLGYGEMTTVLEIGEGKDTEVAYKRLAMFRTEEEIERYEALYREYVHLLRDEVGLRTIESDFVHFIDEGTGKAVAYIVQKKVPAHSMGQQAIHFLRPDSVEKLVVAVANEIGKAFDFNRRHPEEVTIGLDGQISNWAIAGFDPEAPRFGDGMELVYLDTSTPLVRKGGEEQLNPELFLRSAPSFLVWIIRLLFLKDVVNRYYEERRVLIDLIANFYKEQRRDLVPGLIEAVNSAVLSREAKNRFAPLTEKDVRSYYREDVWIWRTYLTFRMVDRFLHRLARKPYPYVLPGKIER